MPSTLVVVDMQPVFEASRHPDTIIAVTTEILAAKQKKWPIILVEYKGCGRTHGGFDALLRGYPRKARIGKWNDDGSAEVIRTLVRREFPYQTLRVCGVNTDCCVWATVHGLLNRLEKSKVEVVKRACNTLSKHHDWRTYLKHQNLKLV